MNRMKTQRQTAFASPSFMAVQQKCRGLLHILQEYFSESNLRGAHKSTTQEQIVANKLNKSQDNHLTNKMLQASRQLERARKKVTHERAQLRTPSTCWKGLVFCNSIKNCRVVVRFLEQNMKKLNCTIFEYHSRLSPQSRAQTLKNFCGHSDDKHRIFVCSAQASKGINFDGECVTDVVLFDMPSDVSEFIRRVGRTGRGNRAGRVTILSICRQNKRARNLLQNASKKRVHRIWLKNS